MMHSKYALYVFNRSENGCAAGEIRVSFIRLNALIEHLLHKYNSVR